MNVTSHPARAAMAFRQASRNLQMPIGVSMMRTMFNFSGMNMLPGFAAFDGMMLATERAIAHYKNPQFNVPGAEVETLMRFPFLEMLHFKTPGCEHKPRALLFGPMLGHDATVMNDTVRGLARSHDVYLSAPVCASQVPVSTGPLTLNAYRNAMLRMIRAFNGDVHVFAVSQPNPLQLSVLSVMAAEHDPAMPHSATFIGGPVDTRINPGEMNRETLKKGLQWFRDNLIVPVESGQPGAGRDIYPAFMHDAVSCIAGNQKDAPKNMVTTYLDANYFLETIKDVFIEHALPQGQVMHTLENGKSIQVDPKLIKNIGIMSIEGDKDDITPPGQNSAVLDMCESVPNAKKTQHLERGAGHYGVAMGNRFHANIVPAIEDFVATHDRYAQNRAQRPLCLNPAH